MKKIILFTSLFMALPVLAECPADKPAKWLDGKCYTCLEIKDKLPELKGLGGSVQIDSNASEQEVDAGMQEMNHAFEMFALMMQLSEACPEAVDTENQQK